MRTLADLRLIVCLLLISALISSILCVYIFVKSQNAKNSFFFIIGQILGISWNVLYIFELLAPTLNIRWFIIMLEYIPICFLGVVLFHFVYQYTQNQPMHPKVFFATFIPSIIGYLSVITNGFHYQFYEKVDMYANKFGIFTYYIILMTGVYFFLSALLFLIRRDMKEPIYRVQAVYYSIAILIPLIVHLLQVFGIIKSDFSITLLFLPFSMLILTILILKYQFLDIIPSAINRVIDNTIDGLLVVNNNGIIIDYNTRFFEEKFDMYDMKYIQTIQQFIERLQPYLVKSELFTELLHSLRLQSGKLSKGTLVMDENIVIDYTAKPLSDYRNQKTATLITFFDMSDIYILYNELDSKNNELNAANKKLKRYLKMVEKLTVEEEINRIMTEIHDTLGHSMTELLALLEMIDMLIGINDEDALETIYAAINKARNSLNEIRSAVRKYKKMGGLI